MGSWETGGTQGGTQAGDTPTLALKKKLQVVVYPGEAELPDRSGGTTLTGHLYVEGAEGGDFSTVICGGPQGPSHSEAGGHSAGETKAGTYTLGPKHHHVTRNWPMSSIPWGASLSTGADGEVYYTVDGGSPVVVTGPDGCLRKARETYYDNTSPAKRVSEGMGKREAFVSDTTCLFTEADPKDVDSDGNHDYTRDWLVHLLPTWDWKNKALKPKWFQNDFGLFAWNLIPSAFYIHTTPQDEWTWILSKKDIQLENSHGCIHVHPSAREKLENILKPGIPVIVKKYGEVGPLGKPT